MPRHWPRCWRRRVRQDVLVRVNPQVAPETHHGLAVGAPASKFGVLAEELPAVIDAGGGPRGPLRWRGIHLHVGSQLGAVDAWRSAFRVGLRLLELQRARLRSFDTLDTGGGFPVAYGDDIDSVPALARFAERPPPSLTRSRKQRDRSVSPLSRAERSLPVADGWSARCCTSGDAIRRSSFSTPG